MGENEVDRFLRHYDCLEADTLEVAKILAEDTYLINHKIEELCDRLLLPVVIKASIKYASGPIKQLKDILDAWVSKLGSMNANVGSLAETLKDMQLIAVSGTTSVVFVKTCRCATSRSRFKEPNNTHGQDANNIQKTEFAELLPTGHSGTQIVNDFLGNPKNQFNDVDGIEGDQDKFLSALLSHTTFRKGKDTEKIKLYMHNVPERGKDKEIVDGVLGAAKIDLMDEIEIKREERKAGWWRGLWRRREKDKPMPLKIKLKRKRNHSTLDKSKIIEQLQKTYVCAAFDLKITDNPGKR